MLFDGSASLVAGDLRDIIREELGGAAEPAEGDVSAVAEESGDEVPAKPETVPAPSSRFRTVRLRIGSLDIAKTNNLQPYLFKVLQEQDAGAELTLTVGVRSDAGITSELLDARIVEAFSQLGIRLEWEADGEQQRSAQGPDAAATRQWYRRR